MSLVFSSVRQNVVAFLSDLFYVLEVRPVKCVRPPGLLRDRHPLSEGKTSPPLTTTLRLLRLLLRCLLLHARLIESIAIKDYLYHLFIIDIVIIQCRHLVSSLVDLFS